MKTVEEIKLAFETNVQFALIDDLNKEYQKISSQRKTMLETAKRLDKELFSFRDLYNIDSVKFIKLIDDYTKMAKELGINLDGKYQKEFDDLINDKKTYSYLVNR